MGVAGSGKTTIGTVLAQRMRWPFLDADTLHPAENIEKMTCGNPLTETDRAPWLILLRRRIEAYLANHQNAVVACSALRPEYRELLTPDPPQSRLVYLKASPELLCERLARRHEHFMPACLLQSQLDILQEPTDAIVVDASKEPEVIVDELIKYLGAP